MLRVETLVLQWRNWKGSVFGSWCLKQRNSIILSQTNFRYLQAISLHSSIWRRPIISPCEASQFFVVVENVEVSLSPESESQFFTLKTGLYDENAKPCAHSREKTPNKNPRPHFERKGKVFRSFRCSTQVWNPKASWRITQFQHVVRCPLPCMLLGKSPSWYMLVYIYIYIFIFYIHNEHISKILSHPSTYIFILRRTDRITPSLEWQSYFQAARFHDVSIVNQAVKTKHPVFEFSTVAKNHSNQLTYQSIGTFQMTFDGRSGSECPYAMYKNWFDFDILMACRVIQCYTVLQTTRFQCSKHKIAGFLFQIKISITPKHFNSLNPPANSKRKLRIDQESLPTVLI